ncbi:MAG TPA: acetate/propionate family kinase [Nocardioidaceae bacterium]|nr:acetate/propionate family kinase [Nocardioidaceae bacterium]
MHVLVVNAGSSSLKLSLLDGDRRVASTTVERWEGAGHLEPVRAFVDPLRDVEAVGHRVVHGGQRYDGPVLVDDAALDYLDSLAELAPLHNPRCVAGIREVRRLLPDLPMVACFDTAFHAAMPAAARTYALPREWNRRWSLRRYGFHGLSHAYAARRAAEIVGLPVSQLRMVCCHLGAGASLAAVRYGAAVDTTMGFTPLAGLVMATRSGSLDPGLLLWLLRSGRVDGATLSDVLENGSGLKGLSGTTGDLRDVLRLRSEGDPDAALAYDVFTHRLRREIGAMAASAHGLDLLVMTGGIGEHSPEVRASVCGQLGHLGVAIDTEVNAATQGDADLTAVGAAARTVVVTAAEDVQIAREVRGLLGRGTKVTSTRAGRL